MKAMLKSLGGKAYEKMSADATKTMMIGAMIVHIGVNIGNFAAVNDNKNDKKAKKETFQAHAIISSVVFGLLLLIKLFGIIPVAGEALKQDIFDGGYSYVGVPFFIHLVASIVTAVLSFVTTDYDPQLISNIFNGISTFVCITIFIFACCKTEDLDKMVEEGKKMKDKISAPTEGTATENPVAEKPSETDTAAKEFGKRQRRRNPPKRRKKKY